MSLRPVRSHPELLTLTDGDPWVCWAIDLRSLPPAWYDPEVGLVALVRTRRGAGSSWVLLPQSSAAPERALAASGPILQRLPGSHVTVSREVGAAAVAVVPTWGQGVGWDWMWTTSSPPPVPWEDRVVTLDTTDPAVAAQLIRLLQEHSPRHSARPGDERVVGWVGVRRGTRLIACAAWFLQVPAVPLLASVAVHPTARRRGLGAAVTAALTRRALTSGSPAVTVDLYADNDDARRIYRRLGFVTARRFISWPMRPPAARR